MKLGLELLNSLRDLRKIDLGLEKIIKLFFGLGLV